MLCTTRLLDFNSGHDACPPTALITASVDVLINNRPTARLFDKYNIHSCDDHFPHFDFLVKGKPDVLINNRLVCRVTDITNMKSSSVEGSKDSYA